MKNHQTMFPITKTWADGKKAIKNGERDKARDCFDFGIAMISKQTLEDNLSDSDLVEDVKRDVWLQRFWKLGLENNGLLL